MAGQTASGGVCDDDDAERDVFYSPAPENTATLICSSVTAVKQNCKSCVLKFILIIIIN